MRYIIIDNENESKDIDKLPKKLKEGYRLFEITEEGLYIEIEIPKETIIK